MGDGQVLFGRPWEVLETNTGPLRPRVRVMGHSIYLPELSTLNGTGYFKFFHNKNPIFSCSNK